MIHVIKPGLLTTVQDMGRRGSTHLGLSPGGAADTIAFRLANLVAGNDANAAALEVALLGPTLEFEVDATLAICGSHTSTSLVVNQPIRVAAGERLIIGSLLDGARAYLAIRGGIDVPEVMGSCSTFLPAHIGGFRGRALQIDDRLSIGKRASRDARKLSPTITALLQRREGNILVTPSLQSDWLHVEGMGKFYKQPFTVTSQS